MFYVYFIKFIILHKKDKEIEVYKVGYSQNVSKRIASLCELEKPSSKVKGKGKGIKIKSKEILKIIEFNSKAPTESYESYIKVKYRRYKYNGTDLLPMGIRNYSLKI